MGVRKQYTDKCDSGCLNQELSRRRRFCIIADILLGWGSRPEWEIIAAFLSQTGHSLDNRFDGVNEV
jgi:hypothetical protein